MVATKDEALTFINAMTDVDFSKLCVFLNTAYEKSPERLAAEKHLVEEVKAAEKSVAQGNYVILTQLHEFLALHGKDHPQ